LIEVLFLLAFSAFVVVLPLVLVAKTMRASRQVRARGPSSPSSGESFDGTAAVYFSADAGGSDCAADTAGSCGDGGGGDASCSDGGGSCGDGGGGGH
jgi:hypothetical protein